MTSRTRRSQLFSDAMTAPIENLIHCDELDRLPEAHRANYLAELEILSRELPIGAAALQVGSMDGERIIRLLTLRPGLRLTGLEIEPELVDLARANIATAGLIAEVVVGDVTKPPKLPRFDTVLCLNNTLGYIKDPERAIAEMRRLGTTVGISVYGEAFDDALALAYFSSLGLSIDGINDNVVSIADFGLIRRFTQSDVASWGGSVRETPIGYFATMG